MPSAIKRDAVVVFSPSGKRGRFARGTQVLHAARSLGVDIDSVCGGRAMCGRCMVDVTEGELSKHGIVSRADNLSTPGPLERQILREHDAADGRRLGCHATIEGDIAIDVPASSQVHRQVIRKPHEAHDIDVNPIIKPCFVEVTPPDIRLPSGDLQRVRAALSHDWQIDGVTCALPAMRQLQRALREGDWQVTVAVRDSTEIIAVWPGLKERLYGVAVDVGSSTVAAHLCDLRNGDVLASAGKMNPQIRFGEDLMSRVSYIMSNPEAERQLRDVIHRAVNELIAEVAADASIGIDEIVEVTVVGNPIMQHLFLGISPVELGRAPFKLANDESVEIRASELDITINPGGYVYVLPCIAGHVGADTAGVMLAETPFERDDMSLIVDVGTNAEILLGNRTRLLAASSPTGPAFEGAQVSSGQRAAPGAIERVRIDHETLEPRFKIIGCELWSDEPGFADAIPASGITGICGSGIIEAIAEMYLAGVIDANGRFSTETASRSERIAREDHNYFYVLHDGERQICVQQYDVRAIQLAKASMYAGARLLMDKVGIDRVDRIRLAGAFGAQIDVKYAMILGMIPDCALADVSSAGNAAGTGARIALLDKTARGRIEAEVRQVEKIETGAEAGFQEHFVAAMPIPHQSDNFRELAKAVDLPKAGSDASRSRRRRHSQEA